ncbi:MAG: hypothetical protein IT364_22410 [Candidatus Hydrogenedentes bacterium]|nr:hypothetical protein [Candidatus Hydrogenedentota bacterium]
MMTISDRALYARHRAERDTGPWGARAVCELWLPMLLFGSIGAITWAIRGTDGWGGIDGTIVPGLTWGILWYYLCSRKGIDARGVALWLGMGIALGGELGYGQYVSWIRGQFHVRDEVVPVLPALGYAWFMICGVGWGAPGGIVLGWVLDGSRSYARWIVRSILLGLLLVLLFNLGAPLFGAGVIDWLGQRLVELCPGLLFPNADFGIYAGELDKHLARTVYTNTQNFAVLIWWAVAMLVAALQRDRSTLVAGAVIGGGFGIGFVLSALWCLGYVYAPGYIDWWKVWELNAGFNLGVLYVIVLYWATRRVDEAHDPDGEPRSALKPEPVPLAFGAWTTSGFMALGGFAVLFAAGLEFTFWYYFWRALLLGLFFATVMFLATLRPARHVNDLRKDLSLAFSVFLLLFIMIQGATSRTGVVLELYRPEDVDQYAWPWQRIALLVPAVALLFGVTLLRVRRILQGPADMHSLQAEHMIDLFAFIGVVGAVTIWPSEIGVLYAVFLAFTLYAFTRLSHHLCL